MIGKLTGKIDILAQDSVIVDVAGVGYLVYVSMNTMSKLESGTIASLFIETHVREDSIQLLGFLNIDEKDCFLKLNSVSGVGIKVALSILSALNPADIGHAIASRDKEAFRSINGIGPKLAERILLELKDKIPSYCNRQMNSKISDVNIITDAVSALVNLGINRNDAYSNVQKIIRVEPDIDINNLIKEVLKNRNS